MLCRIFRSSVTRSRLILRSLSTENLTIEDDSPSEKPPHTPVMVNEVVEFLNLKDGDLFLDMTFGAGGHSSALLQQLPGLKILALDRDPLAHKYAEELKEKYPDQVTPLLGKFSDLPKVLNSVGITENSIDGILFDLGCSSMQFDHAHRGFSVIKNGPLDMRMNPGEQDLTAADVITHADENDLYKIFKIYGEEKKARKIARAIIQARYTFRPIVTTRDFAELVEIVCGKDAYLGAVQKRTHVATKIFQAVRIFVNNEMNELNYGMELAHKYLKPQGRAVALSFHALEDAIVKKHFTNTFLGNNKMPIPVIFFDSAKTFNSEKMEEYNKVYWQPINKKVIVPSDEEIEINPRSRSAKLRAAIKLST